MTWKILFAISMGKTHYFRYWKYRNLWMNNKGRGDKHAIWFEIFMFASPQASMATPTVINWQRTIRNNSYSYETLHRCSPVKSQKSNNPLHVELSKFCTKYYWSFLITTTIVYNAFFDISYVVRLMGPKLITARQLSNENLPLKGDFCSHVFIQ